MDFVGSKTYTFLFVYSRGSVTAYLLLYVDDIILMASSSTALDAITTALAQEYDMKDLGDIHYFLDISVTRDSSGLFISQRPYIDEILTRAHTYLC